MELLSTTLDFASLGEADLVIEAAFESMAIKKDIFGRLDRIAKEGAVLATNTSFLDVDEIAAATSRPESVVGLHFFSPANVMKLLEIVRGAKTSDAVLMTALQTARALNKVAVVSRVCHGFIANRIMDVRRTEAEKLLLQGVSPAAVDAALVDYGFPMGQFAMMDLVGLDVMGRDTEERSLMGDLVAAGRLGQKSGAGYFDYDAQRSASDSPVARQVILDFAAFLGIRQGSSAPSDLVPYLLYPVVNEAAKLLDENIVQRASDIDVAVGAGYGWPRRSGGPMFWADQVGLSSIVDWMDHHAIAVSQALRHAAERDLILHEI